MPAFPIAKNAAEALSALKAGTTARAMREREAEAMAGARVAFVSESTGPVYERREDAVSAVGSVVDDPACTLVARMKTPAKTAKTPLQPVFRDGRRWPEVKAPSAAVWQMSVSYWKVLDEARRPAAVSGKPARALRRKGGETLSPEEVLGLADSPLLPLRPQKALDFGLFDFPLPENPAIIIADE